MRVLLAFLPFAAALAAASRDTPLRVWREPLLYASAEDVAARLREVLGPMPTLGVAAIRADTASNALVLVATEEAHARLAPLWRGEAPPENGQDVHVLPLRHADARQVAAVLGVVADEATNSLVIVAPPPAWEGLRARARALDRVR